MLHQQRLIHLLRLHKSPVLHPALHLHLQLRDLLSLLIEWLRWIVVFRDRKAARAPPAAAEVIEGTASSEVTTSPASAKRSPTSAESAPAAALPLFLLLLMPTTPNFGDATPTHTNWRATSCAIPSP